MGFGRLGWLPGTLRALAVAGCLAFLYSSCAAIGAVIGTGIGLATGIPAVALVTGPAGAEVGDVVAGKKRAEAETVKRDEQIAVMRAELVEERATNKANAQIDTYNAGARKSVPHVEPTPDADDPRHWFSLAWKALLALLGGGAAYHFRGSLGAWSKRGWAWAGDKLRGRAPSAPKPTPAPVSPPERTPLNPEP